MKIESLLFCNSSYFYHRLIMASGCKWDALPMIHLQRHAKNFQKNWLQSVYGNFAYIFVPRGSSGPISQQVNIRYYLCNKVSKQVGWRTTLLFMMDLRHCHFSWGRINFDIQSLPLKSFFLVNFNSAMHTDIYFFWLHVLRGVRFNT